MSNYIVKYASRMAFQRSQRLTDYMKKIHDPNFRGLRHVYIAEAEDCRIDIERFANILMDELYAEQECPNNQI